MCREVIGPRVREAFACLMNNGPPTAPAVRPTRGILTSSIGERT